MVLAFLPFFPPSFAAYFYWLSILAWPLVFVSTISFFLTLRKHLFSSSLLFCTILLNIGWMRYYLPLSPKDSGGVKILSANVNNFGTKSQGYAILRSEANLITAFTPDIICLQERPHTNVISCDSVIRSFRDYPYNVVNSREDEVLNLAVFSKYALSSKRDVCFAGSFNKYLQVDVNVDGRLLRIFNVHLETTGGRLSSLFLHAKRRNRQVLQLLSDVEHSPYPVLVCGDFNDIKSSYAYRRLARSLSAVNGFFPTYKVWPFMIDHFLATPSLRVSSPQMIRSFYSDHNYQTVTLSF